MPWYAWIGVGFAALLIVPNLIGLFLPEAFSASAAVRFSRPPQEVWPLLLQFERHPLTGKMCKSFSRLPDVEGRPVWKENMGHNVVTIRVVDSDPPRRLILAAEDSIVPMKTRCRFELEPVDGGTRLAMTHEGTISRGTWHVPWFRFAMHVMNGKTRAVRDALAAIAKTVGESPKPA